jgi:hypothetical protein
MFVTLVLGTGAPTTTAFVVGFRYCSTPAGFLGYFRGDPGRWMRGFLIAGLGLVLLEAVDKPVMGVDIGNVWLRIGLEMAIMVLLWFMGKPAQRMLKSAA